MTEIRPIRREEADAFLGLLCEVFSLDPARAKAVFFTEPLFDLNRKWALFEAGKMVSVLTVTPLIFGFGNAIGIAGVATAVNSQGQGCASKLIRHVLKVADAAGEGAGLLFARNPGLYEKNGFEIVDHVIRAPLLVPSDDAHDDMMEIDEVRPIYDRWAELDPCRLRRDERRWRYWQWNYRICLPWATGYVLHEAGVLREAIFSSHDGRLPVPDPCEWFGTRALAEQLDLILGPSVSELQILAHRFPGTPTMFMTDQF